MISIQKVRLVNDMVNSLGQKELMLICCFTNNDLSVEQNPLLKRTLYRLMEYNKQFNVKI